MTANQRGVEIELKQAQRYTPLLFYKLSDALRPESPAELPVVVIEPIHNRAAEKASYGD